MFVLLVLGGAFLALLVIPSIKGAITILERQNDLFWSIKTPYSHRFPKTLLKIKDC